MHTILAAARLAIKITWPDAYTNAALARMKPLFAGMYESDCKGGRPSVAPEKLLRAMLLQVLFSVRPERQLMEQVQYNLLFRWSIGLSIDDDCQIPTITNPQFPSNPDPPFL